MVRKEITMQDLVDQVKHMREVADKLKRDLDMISQDAIRTKKKGVADEKK